MMIKLLLLHTYKPAYWDAHRRSESVMGGKIANSMLHYSSRLRY